MNVLENKIQISKEKLEKIVSIKPPNNRKELQQILGFFNYFSRFIYNYSFYVGPMYKLLNKDSKFKWNENTQRKFDDLKEELSKSNQLYQVDSSASIIIQTDACATGFGAIVFQIRNGRELLNIILNYSVNHN